MKERRLIPVSALLVLLVALIYGQTARHEFLNYDDDMYIYNNQVVKDGFTRPGVRQALFGYAAGNWHPLTWLSHMLDVELFGLRAGGHHVVSAALHAANAVLVLAVTHAMTGALWRSALVAALFAVHPLRVESVAWASERKDVLSALFWLLTTGAYVRFVRRPEAGRYFAVLALFALGLTAKPMLVTLPFALLLLDVWPLGRLSRAGPAGGAAAGWREALLEKVPLLLLTGVSVVITFRGQTRGVVPFVRPEFPDRVANAFVSWVAYLGDFFWPRGLGLLYPYPSGGIAPAAAVAAAALLVALTAWTLLSLRRRPYLAAGWLWYLGTLVPVIGLIQVGAQCRADRYTYLPLLGFTMALVWLLRDVWPRGATARRAGAALAVCWVGALSAAAWVQTSHWRDSLSLLGHTARVTSNNYVVLNNYGEALGAAGRTEDAIATFREAARINPEHCNASYNLGFYLLKTRRAGEALAPLELSLACYRRYGMRVDWINDTLMNLGLVHLQLGREARAEAYVRELLAADPQHAWARSMLSYLRARRGSR